LGTTNYGPETKSAGRCRKKRGNLGCGSVWRKKNAGFRGQRLKRYRKRPEKPDEGRREIERKGSGKGVLRNHKKMKSTKERSWKEKKSRGGGKEPSQVRPCSCERVTPE